jgi:hypothetical protein
MSGDDDDDFDLDAAMDQQMSLQESIFEAAASACNDMNGKWEVEDNGDMDGFLEAIGWGWAKRKAAGLATAVTSSVYEVVKVDVTKHTVHVLMFRFFRVLSARSRSLAMNSKSGAGPIG